MVFWLIYLLGPLSLALVILLPTGLWGVIRGRSVAAVALVVLANPLTFFFLNGVGDYIEGRPALRGMGLPGPEYANIDRATRCLRSSGGCLVRGNEWVSMVPHNAALRVMVHFFGPPAGAYDGPYPTREEARAAVSAGGVAVSAEQFVSGAIPTDAGEVRMDRAVAEKIGTHLFPLSGYGFGEAVDGEQLHAVLWQGRCLILRWREDPLLEKVGEQQEVFVLVDQYNGRPFAVYLAAARHSIRRAAINIFWR